jgi:hypothetical protein
MSTAVAPKPMKSMTQKAIVGDIVHWYPDGAKDQVPFAAIVSSVGVNSVCLAIINPSSYNFMVRDGVRHRYSQDVKLDDLENGLWEHTPRTLAMMDSSQTQ